MRAAPLPIDGELDMVDIVRRALDLRKQKRIGVLHAEEGRFWISEFEFDPYHSRRRISLAGLKALVERLESEDLRKPVAREGGGEWIEKAG